MPNPTELIGIGAPTYTTIQSWEDALDANDQYTGECMAEALSNVSFEGVEYDAANYPHLTAQSGAEHDGRAHEVSGAGNARIESAADAHVINVRDEFVRVSWLEVKGPGNNGVKYGFYTQELQATCTIHLHHCIFHNNGAHANAYGVYANYADAATYIYRNLCYGFGDYGFVPYTMSATSSVLCNTAYHNTTGLLCGQAAAVIANNACFDHAIKDISDTTGVLDYNATSDGTGDDEGANGIADLVTADQFVAPSTNWALTDLLLKAGSGMIGEGLDMSGDVGTLPEIDVSIDKGDTRATIDGAWDIGASQLVGEAPEGAAIGRLLGERSRLIGSPGRLIG